MPFTWDQSAGKLYRDGSLIGTGYSGAADDKNRPAAQTHKGTGPIPRGKWLITRHYDSPRTGPFTLELEPCNGTEVFDRSAFRIHGDSKSRPGTASHGCIILSRAIRDLIWNSGDRQLIVVE